MRLWYLSMGWMENVMQNLLGNMAYWVLHPLQAVPWYLCWSHRHSLIKNLPIFWAKIWNLLVIGNVWASILTSILRYAARIRDRKPMARQDAYDTYTCGHRCGLWYVRTRVDHGRLHFLLRRMLWPPWRSLLCRGVAIMVFPSLRRWGS